MVSLVPAAHVTALTVLYPTQPPLFTRVPIVCQMNSRRKHERPRSVYSHKKGKVPPTIPVFGPLAARGVILSLLNNLWCQHKLQIIWFRELFGYG